VLDRTEDQLEWIWIEGRVDHDIAKANPSRVEPGWQWPEPKVKSSWGSLKVESCWVKGRVRSGWLKFESGQLGLKVESSRKST